MGFKRPKVIIVGAGPAGLMAAWQLSNDFEVHLFEKESKIGKKFLVAGKGGLNITNSIDKVDLVKIYRPHGLLDNVLSNFNNESLVKWLNQLGINTFIGSSGKVFPTKDKSASSVLNIISSSLKNNGVTIHSGYKLVGFDKSMNFKFEYQEKVIEEVCDYAVLALGGASWPQTGSDGNWTKFLIKNGISIKPFQPSNCGINIEWPQSVSRYHEGKALKNIRVSCGDITSSGEALITNYGLEGTAIYPVIPAIREELKNKVESVLMIDFKPKNSIDQLLARLKDSTKYKERLSLQGTEMSVIKAFTTIETFLNPVLFCTAIKGLAIKVNSLRPIEEAISVIGGVSNESINEDFSLVDFPNIYIAGEMLDWDAPTGGFLLQGCLSMGAYIGSELKNKLRS